MKKLIGCARASCRVFRHRYLSFIFRLAFGVIFLISGVSKLSEGAAFVQLVEEANILPHALAKVYGTALPWVEIFVGAFLIVGLLSRLAAGIGGLAALSFIIGNSIRLCRGLYGECGCFGNIAALQFSTLDALIIDVVLLIAAIQIMIHKGEFLSLDSRIFRKKASD